MAGARGETSGRKRKPTTNAIATSSSASYSSAPRRRASVAGRSSGPDAVFVDDMISAATGRTICGGSGREVADAPDRARSGPLTARSAASKRRDSGGAAGAPGGAGARRASAGSRRRLLRRRPRTAGRSRDRWRLRRELAFFLGRQVLVFLPFLPHLVLLVRWQRLERPVSLARHVALVGRQPRPLAHLRLDALLLVRLQRRIALGEPQPFLLALGVEAVPVRRERRQDLPVTLGQLVPGRRLERDLARARPTRPARATARIRVSDRTRFEANSGIPGPDRRRSAGPTRAGADRVPRIHAPAATRLPLLEAEAAGRDQQHDAEPADWAFPRAGAAVPRRCRRHRPSRARRPSCGQADAGHRGGARLLQAIEGAGRADRPPRDRGSAVSFRAISDSRSVIALFPLPSACRPRHGPPASSVS